jgi:hypothetical protein
MNTTQITPIFLFYVGVVVLSCSPKSKKEKNVMGTDTTAHSVTRAGDSIVFPGFEIEVALSEQARRSLSQANETIIVQAYLSGVPEDSTNVELNEMDQLDLGSPRVEIYQPGVAKFGQIIISKKKFEALKDKDFEVLINVFSGRKSSELNLIEVEVLQEPLSKVQGKRHLLKGKLISEN